MGLGIRETFVGVVFVRFCVLSNIVMGFVCVIYLVSLLTAGEVKMKFLRMTISRLAGFSLLVWLYLLLLAIDFALFFYFTWSPLRPLLTCFVSIVCFFAI